MSVDSLWERLEEQLVPVFADYRSRIDELPVAIKADRTLLTEADMAVQDLIVTAIRAQEPDAVIIAEEDGRAEPRSEVSESRGRVWVIDPIEVLRSSCAKKGWNTALSSACWTIGSLQKPSSLRRNSARDALLWWPQRAQAMG